LNYRCSVYPQSVYKEVVQVLKNEWKTKLTPREYAWKRDFKLFQYNNLDVLARSSIVEDYIKNNGENNAQHCPKFAHFDQVFDAILQSHESVGHAKIDRTWQKVQKKYANISRQMVSIFVEMCPLCAVDKSIPSRKSVREPIMSDTFNDRGQVDLIDMQSVPDGEFRWILHYQDHLTKFSYLRAIRKNSLLF